MTRTNEELQAKVAELEARIAELTAPKASNRKRAPQVVVDGIALMDQPERARTMKKLAAASRKNLERLVPLRLKAMGVEGKWRFVEAQGVAPMIEVEGVGLFNISSGPGDWTDYYFTKDA